jgi:dolichol-phosphate mannosyltransferase
VSGKKLRVICIAPAWNEGQRIAKVVKAIPSDFVDMALVVDDGSSDDTGQQARDAGALVLRNEENNGVGAAIRRGIDYARQHAFDVAVIVSGGGKTPPEQIPRLLKPILESDAEFVQGSRYLKGGKYLRMPLQRRWGTRLYSMLFSFAARHRVTDASSGFRAVRLSLFEDPGINIWQPWLNRYELEPYLLFRALRLGHRVLEVPVTIAYPMKNDPLPYTKMSAVFGWWKMFRPILFLGLGIRS